MRSIEILVAQDALNRNTAMRTFPAEFARATVENRRQFLRALELDAGRYSPERLETSIAEQIGITRNELQVHRGSVLDAIFSTNAFAPIAEKVRIVLQAHSSTSKGGTVSDKNDEKKLKKLPKPSAKHQRSPDTESESRIKRPKLSLEFLDEHLKTIMTVISEKSGIPIRDFVSDRPHSRDYEVRIADTIWRINWPWLYRNAFRLLVGENFAAVYKHVGIAAATIVEWCETGQRPKLEDIQMQLQEKSEKPDLTLDILETDLPEILEIMSRESGVPVSNFTVERPLYKQKFSFQINGRNYKKVTWSWLCIKCLALLGEIDAKVATRYKSIAVKFTLQWYFQKRRPTKEEVSQALEKFDIEREKKPILTLEFLDENLIGILDSISKQSGIPVLQFASHNFPESREFVIPLADRTYRFSWPWLYENAFALLSNLSVRQVHRLQKAAKHTILEWYRTERRSFLIPPCGVDEKSATLLPLSFEDLQQELNRMSGDELRTAHLILLQKTRDRFPIASRDTEIVKILRILFDQWPAQMDISYLEQFMASVERKTRLLKMTMEKYGLEDFSEAEDISFERG